jgi:O-antigen ligase
VSTLLTKQFHVAVNELLTFAIEGVGLYFLITNTIRTAKILRLTIWVLLIAGLFLGGLSLYQQITGTYDNEFGGFAQVSQAAFDTGEETLQGEVQKWRLAGPLGQQNRYAQIMLMLAPLGLFRLWGEPSKWLRLLAAIATVLITIGAMLTFSRGAAVGFLLILIIMGFMRYIKIYQLIIVCLGLGLLMQAFPQYGMRLTSLEAVSDAVTDDGTGNGIEAADGSTRSRVTEMMAAWLMFTDHPIIGVGPGMYRHYYQEYAKRVGLEVKATEREAHSLYLGLAAENGMSGLICFSAIVLVMLANLAHIRKRFGQSRPEFAHLATGFILAILAYLATGIFLHFAFIRFFWLIMALAGSLSYVIEVELSKEKETAPPELATMNVR